MNQTVGRPYEDWHALLSDPRFSPSSTALRDYLKLCEGLESPTPYHIWSFVSLMGALCGSRLRLTNGPLGQLRLNLGIIFTGVPALRKSSALTLIQKFAEGLPIQYGPTDTSGQRQGLMSAMLPRWQKDSMDDVSTQTPVSTLEEFADFNTDSISAKLPNPVTQNASEIYFVAKELGRLLASSSHELLNFFNDAMDGNFIDYQLKNQHTKIQNPLINLLGTTTPANLGHMMPKGGGEHGFLSRLIFVHADSIARTVPIPERWTTAQEEIRKSLHDRIAAFLDIQQDEISLSLAATETYRDLYSYIPPTSDVRLLGYAGRRAEHLLKISAILALLRAAGGHTEVQASDIRLGHGLLALTEILMDRAYYGLDTGVYSRVLCAITELIEGSPNGQINSGLVQQHAGHLADRESMDKMLHSLCEQGKLKQTGGNVDPMYGFAGDARTRVMTSLRNAFKQSATDGSLASPNPDEFRKLLIFKPQIVKAETG